MSAARQIFIIGSPRSGTSALAWALAQHPEMWTSAESDFLIHLFRDGRLKEAWDKAMQRPDRGWLKKHEVEFAEFASHIGTGVDALFRSRARAPVWIDQTPGHTLMADLLKLMFPEASFIHIVRDGREVVNSMLNSDFQLQGFKMDWTTDFKAACKTWAIYACRAHSFVVENPECAIEIRNEELRDKGEAVINAVLEFLQLPPSDKPSEFLATRRLNSSYDKGGKTTVNAGAEASMAGRYRDWADWPASDRKIFQRHAGDISLELGYLLEE